MKVVQLGDIARATSERAGGENSLPVYSVTKHDGFVRSDEYFKKQVFSRDLSNYKLVRANHFAYATIHLDEGSIGIAPEDGLVSPMYTSFFTDSNAVLPDYLIRFLRSPRALATYPSLGKGSAERRRSISFARLSELRVPLPPLEEQRRIAAILDKADELRTRRREALAHLDTLTQSIFHSMFGDPIQGKKWPLHRLEELGRWQSGGTPSRSTASNFKGNIPWYSSGELEIKSLGIPKECISEAAMSSSSAKLIHPGSLLLGMYDTAALKSGITQFESSCNQAIAFARLDDSLASTDYVYHCIQIGRTHYMRIQRGVRQKNLNLSMVRGLQVPLPPLELQQTFATRVAAVDRLKELHRKHLAELDALFASLQHRAFNGEL